MQELPPGFRIVQQGNPDPVIAPPDPYKQRSEQRADRELRIAETNANLNQTLTQMKIDEQQAKVQEQQSLERQIAEKEQEVLLDSLRRIELIDEVYADATNKGSMFGSLGEVGYWGNKLSETGNTAAYDLAQKISTLQGVEAIDKLLDVKSDPRNPTGGAFGQLSDKELTLLKNYTGSLAQGQSIDEFQRGLGRIKRAALDIVKKMDPARYEAIINRGEPSFNPDGSITYDERGKALFGVSRDEQILGDTGSSAPPADIQEIMRKYGADQ